MKAGGFRAQRLESFMTDGCYFSSQEGWLFWGMQPCVLSGRGAIGSCNV